MSLDRQFNQLNDKLQLLLRGYQRLQRENERLRGELETARREEAAARQRVDELRQQIAILKAATGELSEKERKEFEKRISGYIRELDKTIAFLSQ